MVVLNSFKIRHSCDLKYKMLDLLKSHFSIFFSLEHKKGEDFFSMDKGLFYSTLLENFGPDPILKLWLPWMHKLAESHQVSSLYMYMECT